MNGISTVCRLLPWAIAPILLLANVQAIAQCTTETDRLFVWTAISGTEGYSDLGNPSSSLEPWYLNTDLIIRRGDMVTFETVSPHADYVQFLGNCQAWQVTPRAIGEFIDSNTIRYSPAEVNWQPATDGRSALLNTVCNTY
jgi:hypothetical protein